MKTLPDLLREADPLGYELPRSAQERRRSRAAILDSPHVVEELPRRRIVIGAVVVSFVWPSQRETACSGPPRFELPRPRLVPQIVKM